MLYYLKFYFYLINQAQGLYWKITDRILVVESTDRDAARPYIQCKPGPEKAWLVSDLLQGFVIEKEQKKTF